jgi:hypothetical protein
MNLRGGQNADTVATLPENGPFASQQRLKYPAGGLDPATFLSVPCGRQG